jgi:hypothetical protein
MEDLEVQGMAMAKGIGRDRNTDNNCSTIIMVTIRMEGGTILDKDKLIIIEDL